MQIDRKQFLDDELQDKKLRENVRNAIKLFLRKKALSAKREKLEEKKLRSLIQGLISEVGATDVPSETAHASTGINVLEDLLKKVIPILEEDFKALTTSDVQRKSFRAHVIQAVINSLTPDNVNKAIPVKEELAINIGDTDNKPGEFIDIDPAAEETPDEKEDFGIEGEDVTGRNFAYTSYNKIEKNILDAYESLADQQDRELFYDYLITNLKLYFDKFEDELQANLQEPTTPEYEQAKKASDVDSAAAGTSDELTF
tara:strand:+ start:716 stop:1486 length:771 start_codon:yes stop_codon:yes gene_type:complete